MSGSNNKLEKDGFGTYASLRIVIGIVVVMGCLWLGALAIAFFSKGEGQEKSKYRETVENHPAIQKFDEAVGKLRGSDNEGIAGSKVQGEVLDYQEGYYDSYMGEREDLPLASADGASGHSGEETEAGAEGTEVKADAAETGHQAETPDHGKPAAHGDVQRDMTRQVIGTAFIDALCQPLRNELENSLWGWRPNDIWMFKFGMDNAENYQLGLIEMTRRSANILSERISRTGTNVYINENLQKARSNLNIDPTRFWFPSAENEYKRAIDQLQSYIKDVGNGQAYFFTRADNLIPLLMEFRTQLGDCDNKLIRMEGDPRSQVSTFEADNRFYYAKGVAAVILPLLKAIEQDFNATLKSRDGLETLHHAIEACEGAAHLSPWIVFEGDYDGFFANHRANMSTYISHARFYIGVLITTLAT
jgi:hypothetical protein